MNYFLLGLIVALNVIVQLFWVRKSGKFTYGSLFLGFFMGLFAVSFLTYRGDLELSDIILYGAISYCYFHYVNIGEASVRIRVLSEILSAGGTLEQSRILELYDANHILEARLNRLTERQELQIKDQRFYLGKPRILLVAKFFRLLKLLLMGKKYLKI